MLRTPMDCARAGLVRSSIAYKNIRHSILG